MRRDAGRDRERAKRNRDIVRAFNLYKHGVRCKRCGESHPGCLLFYDPGAKVKVSITYAKNKWRDGDHAFEMIKRCECYCSNCFAKKFERTDPEASGLRAWLTDYKRKQGCVRCNEHDPDCLEFHHKDPSKKRANISQYRSKSGALKEMKKCEILCLRCHDMLHWEKDKFITQA